MHFRQLPRVKKKVGSSRCCGIIRVDLDSVGSLFISIYQKWLAPTCGATAVHFHVTMPKVWERRRIETIVLKHGTKSQVIMDHSDNIFDLIARNTDSVRPQPHGN